MHLRFSYLSLYFFNSLKFAEYFQEDSIIKFIMIVVVIIAGAQKYLRFSLVHSYTE